MAVMTGNAIREALEPFAKIAEHDIGADEADTDFFQPMVRYNSAPRLTVGDLRRARTAYDAIGSGVKALEWSGDHADTSIGRYAIRRTPDGYEVSVDGEEIAHLGFDAPRAQPSARDAARDFAQADFERRVLSCLSPVAVEASEEPFNVLDTIDVDFADSFDRPLLSTHTAAGAGPVGEAVAPHLHDETRPHPNARAICEALGFDPTNHHNAAKCPYCIPVEEPGEVEGSR